MIFFRHEAPHLFREDAFSEYCWSVDAWGAHQPMSFIFLSNEGFKNQCSNYGLSLFVPKEDQPSVHLPHKKYFSAKHEREYPKNPILSYGLITRVENLVVVRAIKEKLDNGNNVLALLPNEAINIWYQGNDKKINEAVEAAKALGVNNAEGKITKGFTNREAVTWEEISINTKGRLFLTRDAFISDAYFMEGYGSTPENDEKITSLAYQLAQFNYPLIRCEIRNPLISWPSQEPLNLVIDLYNHSSTLKDIEVSVSLADCFEPISPTERVFPVLKPLARASFILEVLPQSDGIFSDPIIITAKSKKKEAIQIINAKWEIEIMPSHAGAYRGYAKEDDSTFSGLISVTTKENIFKDIRQIIELARVDVLACLNRMRSVTEKLIYRIIDKFRVALPQRTFASAIYEIQARKILSNRTVGYLHTVRVIGNLASHPSGENLTDADVRITAYALAAVIEELVEKKLL